MVSVVYCRVSSKGQGKEDKWSLKDQESYGVECLKAKGFSDIQVIQDTHTGNSVLSERLGGGHLSKLIESNQVEALYVKAFDRLYRNSGRAILFIDVLVEKGIKVFIDGVQRDLKRADDVLLYSIEAIVAANERQRILARTRDGRQRMRDSGRSYNKSAYGFRLNYDANGKKSVVVDEVEGPTVKQMFRLRAEGKSLTEIVEYLNENGIPTKAGKIGWHSGVVMAILKNPIYVGLVRDSQNQLIPSTMYPQLLDEKEWDAAQEKNTSIRQKTYFSPTTAPLGGILRCGTCNAPFYFRDQLVGGKYRYKVYYHHRSLVGTSQWSKWKDCPSPAVTFQAALLEDTCAQAWLTVALFGPFWNTLYDSLQKKYDLDRTELELQSARYHDELRQIAEKETRIKNAIVEGAPFSLFKEEIRSLEKHRAEIDGAIRSIEMKFLAMNSSLQELKDQFSKDLIATLLAQPRQVFSRSVSFRVVTKERIEMISLATGDAIATFNPDRPMFLFSEWGGYKDVSIDLEYQRIAPLYRSLKSGSDLFEALEIFGFSIPKEQ